MTFLQKGARGMSVLFDLNFDLLLYVGTIVLAMTAAAQVAQFLF